jgi:two-component system phosphate regulon sensor histidine kinase PhoR
MAGTPRKLSIGILSLLLAGTFIGWLYGRPDWGLLGASLLVLFWLVRQLLAFERALRTNKFDEFRFGEGIWEQMLSKYRFERERASRRKTNFQTLLREVRKSTNAMPDGAVILDAHNEILNCNRAAKQLAGLKRKKDRGQRVDNILRAPKLVKLLQSNDFDSSVEVQSPVNDDMWLNCRVVRYGADQKLLLLRDVTEQIRGECFA